MDKYWQNDVELDFNKLDRDINCDVAIIGGGLAGVVCAEKFASCGKSVVVLEANKICSGQTKNSSAMISYAHDTTYHNLIKKHNVFVARQYFDANKKAICEIENLISKYNISCDYKKTDMYLFATTKKGEKELLKEHKAYSEICCETNDVAFEIEQNEQKHFDENNSDLLINCDKLSTLCPELVDSCPELPYQVGLALKIPDQAQLNPVAFVCGLAKALSLSGVQFFENTTVTQEPKNNTLSVCGHTVTAKYFVIATHFPIYNFADMLFAKMFQSRSHNIVFKSEKPLNIIYESVEMDGFEYRKTSDNEILCGGANIRTGKYKHNSQYKILEEHLQSTWKTEEYLAKFSAQDCITFDGLPFAGKLGNSENAFVVTGFNKWGFTNSIVCANILNSLINEEEIDNIFDTNRLYLLKSPLKATRNIIKLADSFADYIFDSDCKKVHRIQNGQGAIVKQKGHRIGVYKDDNGKIHTVNATCTHLGCPLKWNKDELSWDCPCHGSRFDIHGNILDNPAVEKLTNKSF